MVSNIAVTIEKSSINIIIDPLYIPRIPFQEGKYGVPTIKFFTDRHGGKDTEAESNGLSWSNGRSLLDRSNFTVGKIMAQDIPSQGGLTSASFTMESNKMVTLYDNFFKTT